MADFLEITANIPLAGHLDRQCLHDFALGRLSIEMLENCVVHLESCEVCCQYLQTIQPDPLVAMCRQVLPTEDRTRPTPILQKYEVLQEIGRGGMSVVYKARQLGLERIVALKQIKIDAVTPEGVARFRAEAGAMARVRHPNIVQVYDFGEQDGRPYLACEFIAGGSLDRYLNGMPLPVRAASRLVATLARAVQVAHDQSVIHRDLKPSNVLLAYQDDGEANPRSEQFWEGVVPKVCDFGLAKLLDQAHGHTQTGDVMGTPGYMAPEQASGQIQQIGPGTDIFAMGIVLYELLTGRQPFRAATIIQTLELIRTTDPISPRRWLPSLPRDLDVICLKCLEKDPHRRYLRAGDLADDLDRWFVQEPIFARPVSSWERGWKWIYRHQSISGSLAVVVLSVIFLLAGMFWHNHTLEAEVRRANANESAALSAYQQGYDVIQRMVEELFDQHVDTEVDDRRMQRLFEIILAYHATVLKQADDSNPEVRFVRASSRFYMGAIREQCEKWDEALPLLESARQDLEEVQQLVRERSQLNTRLAACCESLARTRFRATNTVDASTIGDLLQACEILDGLSKSQPENARFLRRRANALLELATLHIVAGHYLQAEQTAEQSLALQQILQKRTPLRINDRVTFERTISVLTRLRISQDRLVAAEEILRGGEAILMNSDDDLDSTGTDVSLADLFDAKCELERAHGRTVLALQYRMRSIGLIRKVLANTPNHRFAIKSLAFYETSERELFARLISGEDFRTNDATQVNNDVREEVKTTAGVLEEVRSLRVQMQFDQAIVALQKLETCLLSRRSDSTSPAIPRCLADMYFEFAEIDIGRQHLDAAIRHYDQAISFLNEIADQTGDHSSVADMLSNCHRLKAWHLSRAGLVDSAFAEWDLAIKTAVGRTRDHLRAERAIERAGLNDHAAAVSEADQIATGPNEDRGTLMLLTRVYSMSLQALENDVQLESNTRRTVADYYANQAVSCLKRLIADPDGREVLLKDLNADVVFAKLRKTKTYLSWLDSINSATPVDRQ